MIFLYLVVTASKALIDFSRPTNKGMAEFGNTIMSLNGKTGYSLRLSLAGLFIITPNK